MTDSNHTAFVAHALRLQGTNFRGNPLTWKARSSREGELYLSKVALIIHAQVVQLQHTLASVDMGTTDHEFAMMRRRLYFIMIRELQNIIYEIQSTRVARNDLINARHVCCCP
jgi:hypothetical protein